MESKAYLTSGTLYSMPDKQAPQALHSVIAVICDALSDLSPDDKIRALEGVHVALGIPPKVIMTQAPPVGSALDNYHPGIMPNPTGPSARPQPPTSRGRGAPQLSISRSGMSAPAK